MKTPSHRLLVLLLAIVAAVPLAGCGGGSGSGTEPGEHREAGGEQAAGEEADQGQNALEKVPEADRAAFLGLATSIGTLRARAAPVAVGTRDRLASAAPLRAARARVAALRPAETRLKALRERLMPLLARFAAAPVTGPAARRAARGALASADRIEAGLRRYSRRQPAIGGLIPD